MQPFWCTPPFLLKLSLTQPSYTHSLSVFPFVRYTVCSVYLAPGSPVSYNNLVSLVRQLSPLLLPLGDFNLRHPLWSDSVTSPHAHFLTSLLPAFILSCLNDPLSLWGDVLSYSFAYKSGGSSYSAAFVAVRARVPAVTLILVMWLRSLTTSCSSPPNFGWLFSCSSSFSGIRSWFLGAAPSHCAFPSVLRYVA